uniref:Apolipoprotein D n=1 Tax=Oryzias latipes TaxID=8090 RepID=A0A3B3I0H6_ORYLA
MRAAHVISMTLLLAFAANAQVFKAGKCPTPAVQANFDASKYLGRWFEIQRLPTSFQVGQCSTAFYTPKAPGVIEVLNSERLDDGTVNSIVGSAKVKDPAEPAKLEVSFYEGKELEFLPVNTPLGVSAASETPPSSCRHSPRSLLGPLHRLHRPLPGVRLHRLRPVPHGAVLDPEQGAHPAEGDGGRAARHPVLHRRRRGQDAHDRPGGGILRRHGAVRRRRDHRDSSAVRLKEIKFDKETTLVFYIYPQECL